MNTHSRPACCMRICTSALKASALPSSSGQQCTCKMRRVAESGSARAAETTSRGLSDCADSNTVTAAVFASSSLHSCHALLSLLVAMPSCICIALWAAVAGVRNTCHARDKLYGRYPRGQSVAQRVVDHATAGCNGTIAVQRMLRAWKCCISAALHLPVHGMRTGCGMKALGLSCGVANSAPQRSPHLLQCCNLAAGAGQLLQNESMGAGAP